MNVFDLEAILRLNTKGFTSALNGAKSDATAFSKGLASAMKIGAAAIGAATTAIVGFGASAVRAGADFDKAMAQVAATSGKSVQEISELREFAQEMGRTTVFSATQSAEALNYMALAGYDATKSMQVLPNVLNLAAAGAMDLALASDMITDTETAFGITSRRTAQMVDEMAKAASTGNTSVQQLGEAFLVVGGLAKELNGGMVTLADGTTQTTDGLQEMEIALTAMANAGVKGHEAGTHLRNMITKLSDPTDAATKSLKKMKVQIFDAKGNMNSLSKIFGDLNKAMATMTQEQRIQTITDLFNARDLASAEAMLAAVESDWDHIGESILQAEGAASKMAKTQLDNLAGDVTLFKSALEGAQIAISDELTPSLREFVQFGSNSIQTLTKAFEKGGIGGFVESFGMLLSEGLVKITEKSPEVVEAGVKFLSSFIKGLLNNKKKITQAAKDIIKVFTSTIGKEFPKVKGIFDKIQKAIDGVFSFVEKNGYTIESILKGVLVAFLAYEAISRVMRVVQISIAAVTAVVKILNGTLAASAVINPYAAVAAAISMVIGLITTLSELKKKEFRESIAENEERKRMADEYISKLDDMYDANKDVIASVEEEYKAEKDLLTELKSIVDENGRIKDGYNDRAQVITNELSEAFGIEILAQEGVIQNYDEILQKMDEVILKKKIEALINANQDQYSEALKDQIALLEQVTTQQDKQSKLQDDLNSAYDGYNRLMQEVTNSTSLFDKFAYSLGASFAKNSADKKAKQIQEELDSLNESLLESETAYYKNQDFIKDYNYLLDVSAGKATDYETAIENMTNGIIENAPSEVLSKQLQEKIDYWNKLMEAYEKGSAVSSTQMEDATKLMESAIKAFNGLGNDSIEGYIQPLESDDTIERIAEAGRKMAQAGLDALAEQQDSHSPSEEYRKLGVDGFAGYKIGLEEMTPVLLSTFSSIFGRIRSAFMNFTAEAPSWGRNLMEGFARGINDNRQILQDAMSSAFDFSGNRGIAGQNSGVNNSYVINVNQPVGTPADMAREIRTQAQYGLIVGESLS